MLIIFVHKLISENFMDVRTIRTAIYFTYFYDSQTEEIAYSLLLLCAFAVYDMLMYIPSN